MFAFMKVKELLLKCAHVLVKGSARREFSAVVAGARLSLSPLARLGAASMWLSQRVHCAFMAFHSRPTRSTAATDVFGQIKKMNAL